MSKEIEGCHRAVGIRIRLIREAVGLSQGELAKRMTLVRTSLGQHRGR